MNSLIRQVLFTTTRANTIRYGQMRLMSQEGGSKKEMVLQFYYNCQLTRGS